MHFSSTKPLLFIAPLVLILALGAQTTGTLSGTVNNASGAPVPNAAVTVTPVAGGASQRVLTGSDGAFTITNLPPGTYRVDIEYSGYKRSSVQNVELAAGSPAQLRIELQQGDVRETVEVQGSAVLIQQDNAEMARSLDVRSLTQIPLFDRNHQDLVQLFPGVTPPRTVESILDDPQRNRVWETNGQPNWANRRLKDGVENDEPVQALSVYVTPVEGAQQVDLQLNNYTARMGRAAGMVYSPVTRSGANEAHGSVFWFNSLSRLAARNYFNPEPLPQSRFNFNQFGGMIGGPVVRDRTFFLVNYQGDLDRRAVPTLTTVPTAEFRAGDFSAVPDLTLFNPFTGGATGTGRVPFANNRIPPGLISPAARNILASLPEPNLGGFENNLAVNVPQRNDGHRGDFRLDHKAGEATNLFLRYSLVNYNARQESALGPLGGGVAHLQNHSAVIGGTTTFSPTLIMDLRFNYNRYANNVRSNLGLTPGQLGFIDPSASTFAGAGFANLGIPSIQIAGMQPIGTPANYPSLNVDNTLNLMNNWNWMTGRHNFHAGVDLWGIRADGWRSYPYGPAGGYMFGAGATSSPTAEGLGPFGSYANAFAGFLLGAPAQFGRNLPTVTPSFWQPVGSLYVTDMIKVTERLSIELGGRWDVWGPLRPRRNDGVFIYDPASNQLLPNGVGAVTDRGNVETNWKNVSPRFGFAYRALDRTVIRGGYGMMYFQGPLNFYMSSFLSNPGVGAGVTGGFGVPTGTGTGATFGVLPAVTETAPDGAPLAAPNTPLTYTASDIRPPRVHQYNLMLEHDLGRYGLIGSIGYVGNLGRHLLLNQETNASAPGTGLAGLPLNTAFGRTASTVERGSGLTSNYNALQASLTKRFGQSLSFTTAYTWSRSLDYGPGGVTPLLNPLDRRANYGPSDWDRTHMFSASHVWRIPIGANTNFLSEGVIGRILGPWQLNGMLRWMSGTPFTLTADPALCNCIGVTPTADQVFAGTSTTIVPVPTFFGFFPVAVDTANFAFAPPAPGSLGNLGRNSLRGDDFFNYDVSLFRSFVIHDQTRFELRGEVFNVFNTPQFANPVSNINSAAFGQSVRTLPFAPERRIQFAARLLF